MAKKKNKKSSSKPKPAPASAAPKAPEPPPPPPPAADGASPLSSVGAMVIWAAAAIGGGVAIFLFYEFVMLEFGPAGFESACGEGKFDCAQLNTSRFGKIAGIPITVFAVPVYGAIALLAHRASTRTGPPAIAALTGIVGLTAGAVAYGLFLVYVMVNIEETFCKYCLTMDAMALVMLSVSAVAYRKVKGAEGAWADGLRDAAIAGFVLLLVFVGVFFAWKANLVKQQTDLLDEQLADSEPPPDATTTTSVAQEEGEPRKLKEGWYHVPIGPSDPVYGPADAKVTVVEFADFECGYCKKLFYSLQPLKEKYKDSGDVRFVFKHFPMNQQCNPTKDRTLHRYACEASYAAVCAQDQGRFWEMHDLMFKNQHKLERDDLDYYAEEVGLDMGQFKRCMRDPDTKAKVMADGEFAGKVDVSATPRTFIDGRYLKGALPRATLEHLIEQALGRAEAGERPQAAPVPPPTRVRAAEAPAQVQVSPGDRTFWIDTFESSVDSGGRALSMHGVLPANASWYEAKASCEAAGKRLCDTYEWVSACQDAAAVDDDGTGSYADDYIEGNQFPYADYYQQGWCHDTDLEKRDAEGKITAEGSPTRTGSKPRCATQSGIFDLSGNVAEWVGRSEGDAVLLGGDFRSKDKTGCFRPNPTWGPGHKNTRMGFRCCSDEAVEVTGTPVDAAAPATMIGTDVPEFGGELLEGGTLSSSEFKGKVTYLSFYASWCGPCKRELPALNTLHQEYADRGFQVVAIGVDTDADKSRRMAEKYGVQYPVLLDPTNQVLGLFDVKSMPTSYLVDRRGKIVEKKIGFGTAEATLPKVRELVEPHL